MAVSSLRCEFPGLPERQTAGRDCFVTHHRVAGLEDLTEQDGTLTLCKRLSERTEAAGVSDVWTVHTLSTQTHTVVF